MTPPARAVVVGFTPTAGSRVLLEAAGLARAFDTGLIVAYSDPTRSIEGHRADGSPIIVPIDSDTDQIMDDAPAPQVAEVQARVEALLAGSGAGVGVGVGVGDGDGDVAVEVRGLLGDPATALTRLAAETGARFVVVGAREHGWRASLHAAMQGSIAVHLSLHQTAPVVVVPATPDAMS